VPGIVEPWQGVRGEGQAAPLLLGNGVASFRFHVSCRQERRSENSKRTYSIELDLATKRHASCGLRNRVEREKECS